MNENDQWEIEAYNEGTTETNSVTRNISLNRGMNFGYAPEKIRGK